MVKLTPSELAKPNSKTGQSRIEILKDLVRRKEPLTLHNGSFVVVVDIESALKEIENFSGKPIPLVGISDGVRLQFTTSDLAKSVEFGGGAGVGCGSDQTKVNESAQAVYCASVVNGLAVEELHRFSSSFVVESSHSDILSLRPDWVRSSQLIADYLLAEGLIRSDQTFHHGSEYVQEICSVARRLIEQEGIQWSKDKWNPADIWVVKGEPKLNFADIYSMNNAMRKMILEGTLIGISLKKVLDTPKHMMCNMDPIKPSFRVERLGNVGTFSSPNFFSSKKVAVEYDQGLVTGRTYDPVKNWSLEIDGRASKHGKIGKGPLSSLLVKSGHSPLPDHKNLLVNLKSAPDEFLGLFYDLYVNNPPYDTRMTDKEFATEIRTMVKTVKGMDWVYSKFIGAHFIDTIRQDQTCITDILLYAMSQSSFSAPFIKVQEKTG